MESFLTYSDCDINETQIKTIDDFNWVSDMIIHFWIRYLENKYNTKQTFYFFVPCVTQLFQAYPSKIVKPMMKNIDIRKYSYVFFPMADFNIDTLSASHFSCLYLDNTGQKSMFKHFDSVNQSNYHSACNLARNVCNVFDFCCDGVEKLKCVLQNNGYDCGIYVMAYIEAFIQTQNHVKANKMLLNCDIHEYRQNIKKVIYEMAEKQQKQ